MEHLPDYEQVREAAMRLNKIFFKAFSDRMPSVGVGLSKDKSRSVLYIYCRHKTVQVFKIVGNSFEDIPVIYEVFKNPVIRSKNSNAPEYLPKPSEEAE